MRTSGFTMWSWLSRASSSFLAAVLVSCIACSSARLLQLRKESQVGTRKSVRFQENGVNGMEPDEDSEADDGQGVRKLCIPTQFRHLSMTGVNPC